MDGAIDVAITSAAAGAVSYLNGKMGTNGGPYQLAGFDFEFIVIGAAAAAAYFNVAGKKHSPMLWQVAAGAGAAFAAREAYSYGVKAATPAAAATST